MVVTLLIVAGVAAVYAGIMATLPRRWRRTATVAPVFRPVRTSIDPDPDNRFPLMSGDAF
jgi:hypothetical protein